jgi:ketosteroid isomerase-like protein
MKSKLAIAAVFAGLATAYVTGIRHADGAENIQRQIEAANVIFVETFATGDAVALTALYTDDAQVFPTGIDIVSGKKAIEAYWKAGMQAGLGKITLTTLEAEQHGDTAIEVGQAELFDTKGTRLDRAKYIVVWKRVDGVWKLHRDIFNSNLPS